MIIKPDTHSAEKVGQNVAEYQKQLSAEWRRPQQASRCKEVDESAKRKHVKGDAKRRQASPVVTLPPSQRDLLINSRMIHRNLIVCRSVLEIQKSHERERVVRAGEGLMFQRKRIPFRAVLGLNLRVTRPVRLFPL